MKRHQGAKIHSSLSRGDITGYYIKAVLTRNDISRQSANITEKSVMELASGDHPRGTRTGAVLIAHLPGRLCNKHLLRENGYLSERKRPVRSQKQNTLRKAIKGGER